MKHLTEYNRVSGYLNKIFAALNATYFENALAKPVITIQSTPRAYGHVSVVKVWHSDEEERHELNIGAGTLNRPIENVVATMLHEMVHLYCMQNGIKDTSRGLTYHNKNFKREAEKRDLHIEHDPRIGWSCTEPTPALVEWCINQQLDEIRVCRMDAIRTVPPAGGTNGSPTSDPRPPKKPSSTRKYICPCCGSSVRATRDIKLICGECYQGTEKTLHYLKPAV